VHQPKALAVIDQIRIALRQMMVRRFIARRRSRYVPHLPAAGEIVIFDRSWYNRAGLERVIGFCTEEQANRSLEMAPLFERVAIESGVILVEILAGRQPRRADQSSWLYSVRRARRRPRPARPC
jgi:Polyphosphate kinase 2 (PPK2)